MKKATNIPKTLANKKLLIVGCAGSVAKMMIDIFYTMGFKELTGLDRIKTTNKKLKSFIKLDINLSLTPKQINSFTEFDLILFSIPFKIFKKFFTQIHSNLKSNVVLIDLFSIKSEYAHFISQNESLFSRDIGFISLNPLFRPDAISSESKFLVCTYGNSTLVNRLMKQLEHSISIIHLENFEQHDRLMSFVQVAPHFVILTLATFLCESGIPYEKIKSINTVFAEALFCTISRILSGTPHVYWEIQSVNAYGKEVREKILQTVKDLMQLFMGQDSASFEKRFLSLQNYFKDKEHYNDIFLKITETAAPKV